MQNIRAARICPAGYVDTCTGDPTLFTITVQNLGTHRDNLSAGHVALLERHPGAFRMHVYPTRRSVAWPAQVLAEVKQQEPFARTEVDRLLNACMSAVPFPITTDRCR